MAFPLKALRDGKEAYGLPEAENPLPGRQINMDALKVILGAAWLILRVIIIVGLCVVGGYCLLYMWYYPFLWEGCLRLAVALACAGAVFLILRLGREKDEGPAEKINDMW